MFIHFEITSLKKDLLAQVQNIKLDQFPLPPINKCALSLNPITFTCSFAAPGCSCSRFTELGKQCRISGHAERAQPGPESPRLSALRTRLSCRCFSISSSHKPARVASSLSLYRLRSAAIANEKALCILKPFPPPNKHPGTTKEHSSA